eukprot:TRINITY_DN33341_c0_g1_i2.p1 TRINITY_DN33341_c0_g1~~TRINITY_DN33341_c0_g1_i2.p1  ORF type:complete len:406 (-),score=66.35 TRINITY_DN33341_c0_g1_i2:30-1247(-)
MVEPRAPTSVELNLDPQRTIAMLGVTGAGKSSTVNSIFGRKVMKEGRRGSSSVTKESSAVSLFYPVDDAVCKLTLIDTPGLLDTDNDDGTLLPQTCEFLSQYKLSSLWVVDRFDNERVQGRRLRFVLEHLVAAKLISWNQVIVVLTRGMSLEEDIMDDPAEWLEYKKERLEGWTTHLGRKLPVVIWENKGRKHRDSSGMVKLFDGTKPLEEMLKVMKGSRDPVGSFMVFSAMTWNPEKETYTQEELEEKYDRQLKKRLQEYKKEAEKARADFSALRKITKQQEHEWERSIEEFTERAAQLRQAEKEREKRVQDQTYTQTIVVEKVIQEAKQEQKTSLITAGFATTGLGTAAGVGALAAADAGLVTVGTAAAATAAGVSLAAGGLVVAGIGVTLWAGSKLWGWLGS